MEISLYGSIDIDSKGYDATVTFDPKKGLWEVTLTALPSWDAEYPKNVYASGTDFIATIRFAHFKFEKGFYD